MHLVPKKLWYDAINEAEDLIKRDVTVSRNSPGSG